MRKTIYSNYVEFKGWQQNTSYINRYKELDTNYYKFINKYIDAPILDVGCGNGLFLDYLKDKGFTDTFGIDITQGCVDLCIKKGHKAKCVDAGVFLQSCKRKYSLIIINDVLEHLDREHVINVLSEARACLEPEGTIIARVPNSCYILSNYSRYTDFTHNRLFDDSSLKYVFSIAGLTPIYCGNFYAVSKNVLRGFMRSLINYMYYLLFLVMQMEKKPTEYNIFIVAKK